VGKEKKIPDLRKEQVFDSMKFSMTMMEGEKSNKKNPIKNIK